MDADERAGVTKCLRVALVAEEIRAAPAEGALRFLWHLANATAKRFELQVFHARGDLPDGLAGELLPFAKLRTSSALSDRLGRFAPERVVYAPSASATLNALLRASDLGRRCRVPVGVLALQERRVPTLARVVTDLLRPARMWVLSERMAASWRRAGFDVGVVPGGVDLERFRPLPDSERRSLRERAGLAGSRPLILHVGHVSAGRGLETLVTLAESGRFEVMMVASPLTDCDDQIRRRLESAGVLLRREYVPAIEAVYQMADAYVFPVRHADASIEFPLSVLEAAACGLPVAATRFGSLPEHFASAPGFRYLDEGSSVVELLSQLLREGPLARERLLGFGWDGVCAAILDELESMGTRST